MKINDLNPSLYGVFSLLSLYGGGGAEKPPGLTLALDFRYKTFSSMTYRFWVINILMSACGKQYFWPNDFQSSFQGKVPPSVRLKFSRGAGVVTPSKPPPPYEQLFPLPTPYFKKFLERSLNDPHPHFKHPPPHFKHLSLLPPTPSTTPPPPKNFDHTPIVHAGRHRSFSPCPVSRENCPWKLREVCIGHYYMTNSYRPGIKKFDWFKAGL